MHILQPKRDYVRGEQLFRLLWFIAGALSCLFYALRRDGPLDIHPQLASFEHAMNIVFAFVWGGISLAALMAFVRGVREHNRLPDEVDREP